MGGQVRRLGDGSASLRSDQAGLRYDLVRWLFRALGFPVGAVLLTGTTIVPPPDSTLRVGRSDHRNDRAG
jgi:hypothetical protein